MSKDKKNQTAAAGATKVGAAASAAPGTEDAAAVRRPSKVIFEKVGNEDTKVYPFTAEVPEGFEFTKHHDLKKADFSTDHLYYAHRAASFEYRAIVLRKQAEEVKAMGSRADQVKAKRLIRMAKKAIELRAQLEAQGIDVDALLATDDTEDTSGD